MTSIATPSAVVIASAHLVSARRDAIIATIAISAITNSRNHPGTTDQPMPSTVDARACACSCTAVNGPIGVATNGAYGFAVTPTSTSLPVNVALGISPLATCAA